MMTVIQIGRSLLLSTIVVLFFSCSRDNIDDLTTDVTSSYENVVTTITGRVVSESGIPIPGALVQTGSLNRKTDVNGVYVFSRIAANRKGQNIYITKPGHVPGVVHLQPENRSNNFSEVTLSDFDIKGSFNANEKSTIISNAFLDLEIPPHALVDAFNRKYSGRVTAQARLLSPGAVWPTMSGGIIAMDENNRLRSLLPRAAIYFELSSDSGIPLNLAESAHLEPRITFNENSGLYHFNNYLGYWEKLADLADDEEIDIPRTGYYLIALSDELNVKRLTLSDHGHPIANSRIEIVQNDWIYNCWTDQSGHINLPIYRSAQPEIEIWDGCDVSVSQIQLSASGGDESIDLRSGVSERIVRITGRILDCERFPLERSYMVYNDQHWLPAQKDGVIDHYILNCMTEEVTIQAYNLKNDKKSRSQNFESNYGEIELGDVMACDESSGEYILYNLDGEECVMSAVSCGYSKSGDTIIVKGDHIHFQNPYNKYDFYMKIDNSIPGDHLVISAEVYLGGTSRYHAKCYDWCDLQVDLVSTGRKIGDPVMGTFSGELPIYGQVGKVKVEGEFNVIRKY
ncbi:MAG: carboxypeptidase-like regulatory domain-containing protein [Saprospiraceae bacterium]|nr:carboxypeptidase-like regulatory domain-containing protein [Saprospiraceae bacterium]